MDPQINQTFRYTHYIDPNLDFPLSQNLVPEADLPKEKSSTMVPDGWPAQGAISFKNVEMEYGNGLPKVLKGITLDIKPGERIGVVGRTGAGIDQALR